MVNERRPLDEVLRAVRELRGLGAVSCRVDDVAVTFGPAPVYDEPTRERTPEELRAERERLESWSAS